MHETMVSLVTASISRYSEIRLKNASRERLPEEPKRTVEAVAIPKPSGAVVLH